MRAMGIKSILRGLFKQRAVHHSSLERFLGEANNAATGRYVSPDEALTIPAVYRGINCLANAVSMLPIFVYDKLESGGKKKNLKHPISKLLRWKPNPFQNRVQFTRMIVTHLKLRGNFYAQIIPNGRNEPIELYPLHPDRVDMFWLDPSDEESLRYRVTLPNGVQYALEPKQILHIPDFVTCGFKGISPLDLMIQTVATGIAQEEYAARFFGQGVKPSGVIEHPAVMTKEAYDRLRSSFEEQYGGVKNAHRTILLEEGTKWHQVSITNEQAQYIESRKFGLGEYARIIGLPPHKLYDLEKATFSNIEHQWLEFWQDSINPIVSNVEMALVTQLLPSSEWEQTVIEFNVDAVLRTDIKSRYEAYNIARNGGWMNVDEIRELENKNPLPNDQGQIYLEPLNMKEAGTENPDPKSEPAPEPEKDEQPTELQLNAWQIVLQNRVARAVRREVTARKRKNGDGGNMAEYLRTDLADDVRAMLMFLSSGLRDDAKKVAFITRTGASATKVLQEFADEWERRSAKEIDCLEKWEDLRVPFETGRLVEGIKAEFGRAIQ